MKNKLPFILFSIPFILTACPYQTVFKKPSFKSYSNEVTRDEFYMYFDEQFYAHKLVGSDPTIDVDFVESGYSVSSEETIVKSPSKRQLSRVARSNSSEHEFKFDKDTRLASIDSKMKNSRTEAGHSVYTYSSTYESKVKRQIARIADGAIALYERPKQYEMLGYDTVEEYVHYLLSTEYSSLPFIYVDLYYVDTSVDTNSCKYYVDGSIFSLVYKKEFDNQASDIDRTEDVVISETIKVQIDLKEELSYAYLEEQKETRKFLADTATNLKGEIITHNRKSYQKQQLKLKSTKIKAVDFTLYEKVDSVYW